MYYEDGHNRDHQKLAKDITIKEAGYVYIYFSNESAGVNDVVFDDFRVDLEKSPVIQAEDYYPFGLTFNQYAREGEASQEYLYNGMEMQDELSLDLYDYIARHYDPTTGRFLSIDMHADVNRRWSPYVYGYNNPIRFTDPDGKDPEDGVKKTRSLTVTSTRSTDVIQQTNTTSTTSSRTATGQEFLNLLGKSTVTSDGANGIGNEAIVTTTVATTTSTTTSIEYDEEGTKYRDQHLSL